MLPALLPALLRFKRATLAPFFVLLCVLAADPAVARQATDSLNQRRALASAAYDQANCKAALPHLIWLIEHAPLTLEPNAPSDQHFIRLRTCYVMLAETTPDAQTKRNYLDAALATFDTADAILRMQDTIAHDTISYRFQRGQFMETHVAVWPELRPTISRIYEDTFAHAPELFRPDHVDFVIRTYVDKDDKDGAVSFIDRVIAYSMQLGSAPFCNVTDPVNQLVQAALAWTSRWPDPPEGLYECALLEFEKDSTDVNIIHTLLEFALDLEYEEDVSRWSALLLELDATPATFNTIAEIHLDRDEYEQAIKFFERALEKNDRYATVHFSKGLAEKGLGLLADARDSFRRAFEINSNFGRALMGIASVYQQAVADCGSFEREDRTVYWLVADYYIRASNVDPIVASSAQQQAASMRRYFPSAEEKRSMNLADGASFTVNAANSGSCYDWINETTRVR